MVIGHGPKCEVFSLLLYLMNNFWSIGGLAETSWVGDELWSLSTSPSRLLFLGILHRHVSDNCMISYRHTQPFV